MKVYCDTKILGHIILVVAQDKLKCQMGREGRSVGSTAPDYRDNVHTAAVIRKIVLIFAFSNSQTNSLAKRAEAEGA